MEQIRLLTFGGLTLSVGGTSYTGTASSRQRLALLALLAVARDRGLNRDKIQLYLWPDSDARHARQGLNQVVYVQRRELGSGGQSVFLGRKTLRLNREVLTSDVWEFQDALDAGDNEKAVGLYAGPFLDGFFLKDATEFEHWVTEQRSRLEGLCVRALGLLGTAAAGQGNKRQAIQWWSRAAELNRFDTETALRLIEGWVDVGDRAAALKCAQQYEEALHAELGLPPDPRVTNRIAELKRS
jgi:DNA-binding SARP family transcriptional activator